MAARIISFPQQMGYGPALDDATMRQFEVDASSQGIVQRRRAVLAVCALEQRVLNGMATDDPAAFAELVERVEAFRSHAEGLLEVATLAGERLAAIRANH